MRRPVKLWMVAVAALAVSVSPILTGTGLAGTGPATAGRQEARAEVVAATKQDRPQVVAPQTMPPPQSRFAQGGGCAESCRAQFNQCRVNTKGDPSCNAAFTHCLQRCVSGRGR